MKKEQINDLLSKAEAIELSRYTLYREKRRKVTTPDARKVIEFLFLAEKNHLGIIRRQKRHPAKKIDARMKKGMKIFEISEELKNEKSSTVGDINILKMAEKIEAVDCPFYAELAKKTKEKNIKSLFIELQKQECLHLLIIRKKLKEMQELSVALSRAQNPRFNPRSIQFHNLPVSYNKNCLSKHIAHLCSQISKRREPAYIAVRRYDVLRLEHVNQVPVVFP